MDVADQTDVPDEDAARPRSITPVAFHGGVALASIVLAALEALLVTWAARRWGFRSDARGPTGNLLGLLLGLNLGLCHAAADRLLTWLGLSRSGRAVGERGRGPIPPEELVVEDGMIEVYPLGPQGKTMVRVLLAGCLLGLVIWIILVVLNTRKREDTLAALSIAAFMGALALTLWAWGRRPLLRADARGVTGYAVDRPFRRKFVAWEDVVTCEIATTYDPLGSPTRLRPVLKGAKGAKLLELDLRGMSISDQARLVKLIEARLPKTVIDPGDDVL